MSDLINFLCIHHLVHNILFFILLMSTGSMLHGEQLGHGISYRHIISKNPRPLSIHIVEIVKHNAKLSLVHALNEGLSREPVSSIGERTNALIAINAGNYRRGGQFNGNAVGFLKINEFIYADPNISRASVCISSKKVVSINQIKCTWHLTLGNNVFPVNKINQPRGLKDAIIYNRSFGKSTLTNNKGIEIVVSKNKIIAINHERGNSPIPKDGFVYSVEGTLDIDLGVTNVDMNARLSYTMEPNSDVEYVVSGAGLLIKNANIVNNFHSDFMLDSPIVHSGDEVAADFQNQKERTWLIEERHPRTALGIKSDQTLVFLVVDGRQPDFSEGMNFAELANFLYSLGCVEAVNLGGGGCTTLYIKDRGVVNSPAVVYDSERVNTLNYNERPVSDALIVVAETD